MSKIALFLLMLPAFPFAQVSEPIEVTKGVTVGKLAGGFTFLAELSYKSMGTDTTYTLKFNDYRYEQITSIEYVTFSSSGGAKEKLYNLLLSVFENKKNKDYMKVFTLGDTDVSISNYRGMAAFDIGGPWFAVTKKQLDKLFGRN